jgi:hypothetical protein
MPKVQHPTTRARPAARKAQPPLSGAPVGIHHPLLPGGLLTRRRPIAACHACLASLFALHVMGARNCGLCNVGKTALRLNHRAAWCAVEKELLSRCGYLHHRGRHLPSTGTTVVCHPASAVGVELVGMRCDDDERGHRVLRGAASIRTAPSYTIWSVSDPPAAAERRPATAPGHFP